MTQLEQLCYCVALAADSYLLWALSYLMLRELRKGGRH